MPNDARTTMSMNDPQWGRGGSGGDGGDPGRGPRRPPASDGPPDLEELWRDFNRRLSRLFGRGGGSGDGGRFGSLPPDARRTGLGVVAVLAALALIWMCTGFYIVQEGQVAVVSTFGRYDSTTGPGFRWRAPWPVQAHEIVDVFSVRKVEVGTRSRGQDRLKEALMLTDDENIVDMQFEVQYRVKDGPEGARDFVFGSRFARDGDPSLIVQQTAESAMREVVGNRKMDSVLYESRQQIADDVRLRMQAMLDRYVTGLYVSAVAIQNAQPPEQVQAAFDDAVKAGQDRERQINEGQAYSNDVVPRARGMAARLMQEAEGYRSKTIETAEGDAARFRQVLTEYMKAPAITRERLYIETMQQIFASTTKLLVDTHNSAQLLYLPLDRLMQQSAAPEAPAHAPGAAPPAASEPSPSGDSRAQDAARSRDRESR
jgi:membrane protease subunit HflK